MESLAICFTHISVIYFAAAGEKKRLVKTRIYAINSITSYGQKA